MRRVMGWGCAVCAGAILALSLSAGAAEFSDEGVEKAIARGVEWLLAQQKDDGTWEGTKAGYGQPMGPTALATYALIETGVKPTDPRIVKALHALSEHQTEQTYTLAMRASAYGAAIRKRAVQYRGVLRNDVRLIINSTPDGAFCYKCLGGGKTGAGKGAKNDNSNTNYADLGAWVGQMLLQEVPPEFWRKTIEHWKRTKNDDGGWGYRWEGKEKDKSTAAMCAAGVASMFVCFDALRAQDFLRCNINYETDKDYGVIRDGLGWFDKNFADTMRGRQLGHSDMFYYLYNVERVGLAAGYKYFGTADWYKMGASYLLDKQGPDGSWKGKWTPIASTSFSLLFLIRGRQPVAFNKVEFHGDWNNRPRDMAYLTRWMSDKLERSVGWQIINLRVPVEEWHDAPVLYISGEKRPEFSAEEKDKLKQFVWQGGAIFSVTECDGKEFSSAMRELYAELFPKYKLELCPPEHKLYSIMYPIGGTPKFAVVSNGLRPLAIHTDFDLARIWQMQRFGLEANRRLFEAGANVFMYTTDRTLRNRGVRVWPEKPAGGTNHQATIARLKHAGDFDPEPLAYERFARLLAKETKTALKVAGPMPIAELGDSGAKLAALSGTGDPKLTENEQELLREFLEGGGTLVIDAAGGDEAFDRGMRRTLLALFGATALQPLPADAELYRLAGREIKEVSFRGGKQARGGGRTPRLMSVALGGRHAVFYSRDDITGGLVGYSSYECDGYAPQSAYELMRNIVLYAAAR